MKKKYLRMIIDLAMVVLLPLLMAYALVGKEFHEIAGIAVFFLFILHHIINRAWLLNLFKGKYKAKRIFITVLNLLLLLVMLIQPVSGILMSGYILKSVTIPGTAMMARQVHLVVAYWGYILLSIHAGTHLKAPLDKLKRKNKIIWTGLMVVLAAVSAYGVYAFINRKFITYMFMLITFAFFDFSEKLSCFLIDYVSIMVLFACVGAVIINLLSPKSKTNDK